MPKSFLLTLLMLLPLGLQAGPVLTLEHAWIRLLPAGVPAAGYFELSNAGEKPMVLVSASSPAFGKVQIHRSENHDGVARMIRVSSLSIGAGERAIFAPGGLHLMLMHPKEPLQAGQMVPIVLNFADGSSLTHNFTTRGMGN